MLVYQRGAILVKTQAKKSRKFHVAPLKWLIVLYQWTISPLIGNCCRFKPSCSDYAIQALDKYGALKGCWKITIRLLKCGPWHPGGIDEP
ncbi:MAG: membrane protein insertion efficiency factor YidD [Chlamydiales bacterium]|nr:membrane protein insertion efficiency factor YidD [Chlamydiales bacterium]